MTATNNDQVVLDLDLCEGNGDCEAAAPQVFRLGDADTVEVLDPRPPAALRGAVDEAIYACPKAALSWRHD